MWFQGDGGPHPPALAKENKMCILRSPPSYISVSWRFYSRTKKTTDAIHQRSSISPRQIRAGGTRQPAVMVMMTLDPWFCVPVFQQVCPYQFTFYRIQYNPFYGILQEAFGKNLRRLVLTNCERQAVIIWISLSGRGRG